MGALRIREPILGHLAGPGLCPIEHRLDTCQAIVGVGGRIANIGVHGKPVELHLEKLWDCNIALTTRLVDTVTTPLLLRLMKAGKPRPAGLVTHRFGLEDIMQAYDTFAECGQDVRAQGA
jgi:alcohol dehydrogenase